jgi:hypothetical protein
VTEGSALGSPWFFTLDTGGPVSIPTLDQWGRIILALFIAAIALKYLLRHRGPAALALTIMVFLWTGIVLGAPERWPFSTASHDPTALIVGTISTGQGSSTHALTMRYPLSPAAGQGSVLVITQLAPAAAVNVTSTTLHYQKAGDDGVWKTVAGAPWGAPDCSNCWAASLPLNEYVANDQIRYYLSAATDAGSPHYFFSSSSSCSGVTCATNSTCADGVCVSSGCSAGYSWDGIVCTQINACATNNGGCGAHYLCASTGPGTNSCACLSNWSGTSCDLCASGYYGAACNACPNCGAHGSCDDGLAGTGTCTCEQPDYFGADCHSCPLVHLPNGDCVDNCTDVPGYPHLFFSECVAECPTGYIPSLADICIQSGDDDPGGVFIPPNQ